MLSDDSHWGAAYCEGVRRRVDVIVVGAGFGGLAVARGLLGEPVDVVLIDANNFHTFQPLL
jgi:NADH:ubiquinone reductase (H+-translocating)